MSLWTKLKQNHLLMIVLCCILPLAIILLAIQYFSLSRNYAWWAVLLLCPLTHYFMHRNENFVSGILKIQPRRIFMMMKNMHKSHDDVNEHSGSNSENMEGGDETMEGKKKKGSCH